MDHREQRGMEVEVLPWNTATLPWWKRFRVVEWVVTALIYVILMVLGPRMTPHCREFTWGDGSLSYPLLGDTFPVWSLVPIAVLPCFVFVLIALKFPSPNLAPKMETASSLMLMQLSSLTLAEIIVTPTKEMAGRLRPDYLARLRAAGVVPPTDAQVIAYQTFSYCNVTTASVLEGRRSFPSGHSSTSFASLVPLTLFLIHRLGAFRRGSLLRFMLGGLPMVLPVVVAVSRTWDFHHHFTDILAGSIIGTFAGVVAFRLFNERTTDPDPMLRSSDAGGDEMVPKFTIRSSDMLEAPV